MPRSLKVVLALLAGGLGLYALLRLAFYLANRDAFAHASGAEVAMAFVRGLRFDAATLVILNAPMVLVYLLPAAISRLRHVRRPLFVAFAVANSAAILVNLADCAYFPHVQRRLLFEPYRRPGDLLRQVPGLAGEYGLLFAGGLLAVAAFVAGSRVAIRRMEARWRDGRGPRWLRRALHPLFRGRPRRDLRRRRSIAAACLVLVAAGGTVLARGGFQWRALRPAEAFAHPSSNSVGYLTLNGAYTVMRSLSQEEVPEIHRMPEAEATRLVREMVFEPGERAIDPAYPFLRARPANGEPRDLNVVLFLMESWSWNHVGRKPAADGAGPGPSRTPFFDSLAKEGALFTNVLANGLRSIEAVPSVTASIPGVFPTPLIGSQVELARVRGLGAILAERGYATSFHHGAWLTSMGFDAFTRRAGFERYYSERDYPAGDDARDGKWGVFDELFFLDAARRLDAAKGRFGAVVFSLSPHNPWVIPKDRRDRFSLQPGESDFDVALRYSDWSLSRFFEHARAQPWFAKTVFLVTADHTRFAPPDDLRALFHVPLLVYAPGIVEPAVHDGIGGHADVLPTVLDVLRIPARHASMGRSLFDAGDPARPRFAVVRHGPRAAVFSDRFAFVHDVLGKPVGLFDYREDPLFLRDLTAAHPDSAKDLRDRLFAFLQSATSAVVRNRIWRDPLPGDD